MKRCIDVLFAFCLLSLLSPLLLCCAVLIKLDSEGPVLFRQRRMGRDFRIFHLLKLRTMDTHRPGTAITLGADPRITRVGRFLRKYKVDELPQLWNILRGEMSLVGPRPVIPELTREFRAQYQRLLTVRPGLTDPAALKYYRECEILAVSANPMHHFKTVVTPDKLKLSEGYLQQATIWRDLRVMAQTAKAIIPHLSIQIVVKNCDVPESTWRPYAEGQRRALARETQGRTAGAMALNAGAGIKSALGD
ncbi:MAG TPA: sugar transferase [Terracidiphilus sp.]|nr:sugar transferase [Terracidiphilus sp.]